MESQVNLATALSSQPAAGRAREALARWGAGACALIALASVLAMFAKNTSSPFIDYWQYHTAAVAVRDDGPLYGPAFQWRDSQYTIHHPTTPNPIPGNPYAYPPGFAIALVPLTALPADVQKILWLGILFACVFGTAYVWTGRLFAPARRYRHTAVLATTAALIFFAPVRLDLYVGQVEPMLLLWLSLSLAAYLSRRDSAAGLWLGLAVAVKPILGFLIIFFLWKRAHRAVGIGCAVVAATWLLSLPFRGINGIWDWVAVASYWSSPTFGVTPGNQSLYGFLLRLFTTNPFTVPLVDAPGLPRLVHAIAVLAILVTLAVTIRRSRALSSRRQALEYGLMCVAMLIVSPLSEHIHYGTLAIPFLAITAAVTSALARDERPLLSQVPAAASVGAWGTLARPRVQEALLLLGAVAVYGYISLPRTQFLMMDDYKFYQAPLTMPTVLLTGALLYSLCALGPLLLLTLGWYQRWSRDDAVGHRR
jgi:hypothetical protein